MSFRIKKAVFPVAGLGTRFLPATKTVPKEMLPVIDRPLIQYAVDEAVDAGCDTMVFVTNRYKHSVADYFDKAYELEQKLEKAGKSELLALIRDVLPPKVRAVFVTQAEALGLGHAVLCAKPVIGDEPFAVLLPDDLIWNKGPGALRQMADLAERESRSVIAVQDVPRTQTASYGIVATEAFSGRHGRITALVEKPAPDVAPSTLGVVGRYVLSPRVFDALERTGQGRVAKSSSPTASRPCWAPRACSRTASRGAASIAAAISGWWRRRSSSHSTTRTSPVPPAPTCSRPWPARADSGPTPDTGRRSGGQEQPDRPGREHRGEHRQRDRGAADLADQRVG
jgi:UTP--glucose-1-phosphate uridylyltransferase